MKKRKKTLRRVGKDWLFLDGIYCRQCGSQIQQNPKKRNELGCRKCNLKVFCPDLFRLPPLLFIVIKNREVRERNQTFYLQSTQRI